MNTVRQIVSLAFATLPIVLAVPVQGQSPAPAAPRARLGSTVFSWENLVAKPSAKGALRAVANNSTATLEVFECHITTLNPGLASHAAHKHPQEEFIIIKEGTLEVVINGKSHRAGPGSLLFYASNDFHHVRNVGDQPATYLVFNLKTAATASAPAQSAAESAPPDKLRSNVFDWERLTVKATKTGERRDVLNSPTVTCTNLECHVTTLNPGLAPHAAHRHPDEELVIVKEGMMEVTINGVTQRAGPGSIFFFASNDEHGMKNVGSTRATYHVVRIVTAATPRPAAK
ncbi:MAG: cupin domain-containing protein [Verrucomicrobia bacterium]|nr:cupin domain-containing protein [Verrucomicrobiota bacterium]